jgi:hypothetical protein
MASTYGRRVPTWENEDVKEIYSIVREFADVTAYSPTQTPNFLVLIRWLVPENGSRRPFHRWRTYLSGCNGGDPPH